MSEQPSLRGKSLTKKRIGELKTQFAEVFQTSGSGNPNTFEMDFIKEQSSFTGGVDRLIGLYEQFIKDNEDVFKDTENINDILKYNTSSRRAKFIKTLGELSVDKDNQSKKTAFLRDGVGLDSRQIIRALGQEDLPTQKEKEKPLKLESIPQSTEPKTETETEEKAEEKPTTTTQPLKGGAGTGMATATKKQTTIQETPPTFSPDEMLTARQDMETERMAQEDARAERPTTGMTIEEEDELLDIKTDPEQSVEMKVQKPDKSSEIDKLQPLPSKSDFIPPMRLGTRGKDIKELLDDISYFMKNFKSQLKREGEFFKQIDKKNISQVRELHDRIVGKLAPKQKSEAKRVGIVLNADDYIREQMKRILQEQTFSNLRPQDVVIDVGKREAGTDNKDFGDFEIKRTIDGGLASKREAVYRYMPTENDTQVNAEDLTEREQRKPKRISLPKPRLNNERTTAIRMNVRNPFRVPQKTMKLKYLY
jgi:hypothetical protein